MTLHIVNESGEYRLYRESGERISDMSWSNRPDRRSLSDALDSEHKGASILAKEQARHEFLDVAMGDLVYHRNTRNLPWEWVG